MEDCFNLGAKAYRDGKTLRDNPFTQALARGAWLNGFKMEQIAWSMWPKCGVRGDEWNVQKKGV